MQDEDTVRQEWYCTTSGGGCGGYFVVPLNMQINGRVEIICPNCAHKHQRVIEDGQIKEFGRFNGTSTETIRPTRASFSKKPKTQRMKDAVSSGSISTERDGIVLGDDRSDFLRERWFELYGA